MNAHIIPQQLDVPLIDRLVDIWSRVLQVSPLSPDSNFFDLGGDSLLAVGLFLEIEREIGPNLPITTIYDAPTVAELATLMESETAPEFSPLVLLKEGSGHTPLFIVHGVGGTVIELAALGKRIRTDNPIYAIQARGLDGASPPLDSIETMADYYVDAIRKIQPTGPYLLGGYSCGGLVAMEIARRLERAQEEIGLLLLIDTYAHPQTWPRKSRLTVRTRKALQRVRAQFRRPAHETALLLLEAVLRKNSVSPKEKREKSWLGYINPNLPPALRDVRRAGDVALKTYWPQFYPGKITFLRARKTDPVFPPNAANIWHSLAGEFELCTIPGDHHSIITEHVATTADKISAALAPRPVWSPVKRALAAATAKPLRAGI